MLFISGTFIPGVAYLLHGLESFNKRHLIEFTQRSHESMITGGLLGRVMVYESHQIKRGADNAIPGEDVTVS